MTSINSRPQDRPPLSLPSSAIIPAANGATPPKQPTAAKRMSMRKPHLPPPPNPPKENSGAGDAPTPISRPRPPVRKNTGNSGSLIEPPPPNPKTFSDANTSDDSGPYSPPMPSNPPPPLPADVEQDLGMALTSELRL